MATSTDRARVTADSKPTMKMLQRHVIPHVATKWNELGIELFDEKDIHMLNTINPDHNKDVNKCCHEMFNEWLATYDNATWHQIVEALKSPGVQLGSVAAELEKNLIAQTPATLHATSSTDQPVTEYNGSSDQGTLDFTKFEDVSLAFTALFSTLQKEVKLKTDKEFKIIRNACVTCANQKLSEQIKMTGDIDSLFEVFAENKSYCNWLNVRFLEVIATASGNSKLTSLIQDYEKAIYSKTLREVWNCIPHYKVRTEYYSKLQAKFDGKDPDDVTVEEFKRTCEPYLIRNIAMLIAMIEENSIRITWLIPTDTIYEYYLFALMIPQELRLDSYLQIGDWVVHHPLHVLQVLQKHPLHVLQVLQKDYRWILPSTLLIGYYHSLLMRDINPSLVMDKMCSNGLLAPHDQGTILAGYSIYQRSWLLLEHVRHMEMQALMNFCESVQEILPQVGVQLVAALNFDTTMELDCYTADKTSIIVKNAPIVYSSPSSLHILFLGLMDQVNELLQLYNAGLLMETCRNLMASEPHRINLFSDGCINNLSDYTSAASFLSCLSFLFTWSDHSILRALISCSHEAIELLDKFDSFLDPFNTVASYPINTFSLSMIPFKNSPYTILAIRCNRELWQCSLQYVFNIRSILVELCEITQHCLQLLATRSDPTIFYWNIPKRVVELVEESLEKYGKYFCSQGIVEVTVYPKQLLFIGDDVIVGSLAFVVKQEIDTEDVSSKENAMTELENLKDKISDCNLKLEKSDEEVKSTSSIQSDGYSPVIRPITFKDVASASEKIYYTGGITKTNLQYSAQMSEMAGMNLFFKQEYTLTTGSFKERGVVNALLNLSESQKQCGVIAASAGNHAQALAYHGKKLNIPVTIVMPIISPTTKLARCQKFGADVIVEGDDVVQSKDIAMRISDETGKVYIHGYDDADILAGQGTIGVEVHEQMYSMDEPVDAIVVPVGGGGLIAGISVAMKHLSPNTEVIGVESDHCNAFRRSFEQIELVTVDVKSTLADELAVSKVGSRSFKTALPNVDRVVTVSENDIAIAILRLVEVMKTVVEGAAATGLAACLFGKLSHLKGKNVVVVLTGANIDTPVLSRCLDRGLVADGRLATFRVIIRDRPGGLSELLQLIAKQQVSIRDVFHERPWVQQDMYAVEVKCVVDTTGWEQCNNLKAALEKKYEQHILWGKDNFESHFLTS